MACSVKGSEGLQMLGSMVSVASITMEVGKGEGPLPPSLLLALLSSGFSMSLMDGDENRNGGMKSAV